MLVVAPERWDEACFAVPAVRALAGAGVFAGVFCEAGRAEFWEAAGARKVLVHRGGPKAADVAGEWDAALAWSFGAAAKAVGKAGVTRRIAPAGGGWRLRRWATHPVEPRVHVLEHRVRHYLATVEELGVATRETAYFKSADFDIRKEDGTVLLCPDSDFGPSHEWPLERWTQLGEWLRNECGVRPAVACGSGGRRLGRALAARLGVADAVVDAEDPGVALRSLAAYPLVVAADGSLPHVAGFAGATCVVLFGPNDAAWKRPLGKHHAVVSEHVECAPCLMAKCPMDMRCQDRLAVDRVAAAVAERLDALPGG